MASPNSSKTIVVFGVTGNQGGSAARALLKEGFGVVGITRNPESAKAKALAALGVRLHRADLTDPSSYTPALAGAYGAFFNQDFFAYYAGDVAAAQAAEESVGFAAVAALAEAGVQHVVYSTLESISFAVPHFDGKAAIAARFHASTVPTTFLYTCYYFSNVLSQLQLNGDIQVASPLPDDTVLPSFAVEQVGLFVAAAFLDPAWIGRDMFPVGDLITVAHVAQTLAKVTGRTVRTAGVTHAQFEMDQTTDREWYLNYEAFRRGLIVRDLEASRRIVPHAWDFEAWARQNEEILKLRK